MAKYLKKQIEIEAEQYKEYGKLVKGMCNSVSCFTAGNNKPHVHTIHNNQIVNLEIGDYIIPEPDGIHYYPCKEDIFKKTHTALAKEKEVPLPIQEEGDLYKAIEQIDKNNLGSAKNLIERFINSRDPIQEVKVLNDEENKKLTNFLLWFRENGEAYINKSMESMINIYIQQQTKTEDK